MEQYIGLDAHGKSCTFGVIGPSGRKLRHQVVETNGSALVSCLRSIPGKKHLCLAPGCTVSPGDEVLLKGRLSGEKTEKDHRLGAVNKRHRSGVVIRHCLGLVEEVPEPSGVPSLCE